MKELDLVYRLMLIFYGARLNGRFAPTLVSESVLRAAREDIDVMASDLQRQGYVEGLRVIDDLDGQRRPMVAWGYSSPYVTIKGLEYISENSRLTKAANTMKDLGKELTTEIIASIVSKLSGLV